MLCIQCFLSLEEANRAIASVLVDLNNRPYRKQSGCRRSVFDEIDRRALKPLPDRPYRYTEWKTVDVGPDYHAEINQHYYPVPYRYAREQVEAHHTAIVEVFRCGPRIAPRSKSNRRGHHTTIETHMPPEHQAVLKGCDPQRLSSWVAEIGPHTAAAIEHQLAAASSPGRRIAPTGACCAEQGLRTRLAGGGLPLRKS
ncbi:Mu transposase domain-containing protein [Paraburkholderia caffeinilytica]|uniref:Mu transposase domain-containing protein n=1 Tax=Paraburkholderia caffeinilytica TaxID=1761016 RepID=UPI003DA1A1F0